MQIRILLASLLFVAGCSYYQDPRQAEAIIVAPGNFKAGPGVIEAVNVLPSANKSGARDPNLYRLSLRMSAGVNVAVKSSDTQCGVFTAV